ncbi:MAG: SGNH/GDSL hydrolase family protein, partial [Alphaproteobacteria bacterium]|nr:SGNH/GDSL hydrolase family protein [Alphaproteobacteria bacterium]
MDNDTHGDKHWVGTWAATPAESLVSPVFDNNYTLRMTPRISIGGDTIRVRISNANGNDKLAIGAASVGIRDKGASVVPDSLRPLTFNGSAATVIATGALAISDPVTLDVAPLADLAVSIHLSADVPVGFQVTGRYARQTNYISPQGDFTDAIDMRVYKITDEWCFVSGIDVLASKTTGGVVALGDSLTDGNISRHDAFNRWPDQLARRLDTRHGGGLLGVMNQGLGGNRILHDLRGDSGLRRFDRDVLAQPGVTHAIVMLGTNDLRNRNGLPGEEVTGEQLIAGMHQMALRAQASGIKFIAATLTPFGNETFMAGAWNPTRERHRVAFNEWVRHSDLLDGVVDFDAALRDPEIPTQMLPIYDCGDGLHPSDTGYCKM